MTWVRTPSRPAMPDTDLFTVTRTLRAQATLFRVAHFPSRAATAACCHVDILQAPGESDVAALQRAAASIEALHLARRAEPLTRPA